MGSPLQRHQSHRKRNFILCQGKVCGWIKIQLTEDNRYDITITPDNALESEVIYRFVSLENIVSLIDVNVQYGVSYYDYICSIFGLTHKIAV